MEEADTVTALASLSMGGDRQRWEGEEEGGRGRREGEREGRREQGRGGREEWRVRGREGGRERERVLMSVFPPQTRSHGNCSVKICIV